MAQLTLTIDDTKFADFKAGYLRMHPVPLDQSGNPIMTENNWIRHDIKTNVLDIYREGKRKIAQENTAVVIDDLIVQ